MKTTTLLAALSVIGAAPAQCLFTSVSTQSVGESCNFASTGMCAVVALPAFVDVSLDVANCALDVEVVAFEGCGASVPLRILMFGAQAATIPLPDFGFSCALNLLPDAFLAVAPGPTALALPPAVQTLSFYVQGAALSVPPLSGEGWFTFSAGSLVSLQ
ncbi:MAG: hypothetical protein JNK78_02015 [Planctomycetes bacterium]|nr:hypothetical protein [Planctomycetota bacterium]